MPLLTGQQLAHYNTFGYLFLPQAFSAEEMVAFTRATEEVWEENPVAEQNGERSLIQFVEGKPLLTGIVTDDRIYPIILELLGSGFVWVGSEGHISSRDEVKWHPDRKYYRSGEEGLIDFPQIKMMIYLEKVTVDSGCLRVIPGSHRMPLHKDLADQEINPDARPFGLSSRDIPSTPLESEPGDVILFNHCIWHSAFGGGKDRRYLALKFAAKPFTDDQLKSLDRYTTKVFEPHEAFLDNDDSRIRAMVGNMAQYSTGRTGI